MASETIGVALASIAARELKTTWRQNLRCIAICFLVSLASLQYGVDLSVINAAQAMKGFLMVFGHASPKSPTGWGISPEFQQAITSIMNVGVIVGSFFIEPTANLLGRRRSFLSGSVFCIAGVTVLIVSTNKGAVIFGRFLVGVSNAQFLGLVTIYIAEASPSHLRGALTSFQQLTICIGTIIGTVIVNATQKKSSRLSYQIPLFVLYVIPVFMAILVWFIPESPRWLILKDRREDAHTHLARLRGANFPRQVIEAELTAIQDAVEAEKEMKVSKLGALRLMFSPAERTRTLLTFAALTFHGASGFPFIAGYKTYFIQMSGSQHPFTDSIIVTCVSLVGAIGGVFLNRWIGRRVMLLASFGSQAAIMAVIGAIWTAIPHTQTAGKVVVAMIIIYQCDFSAGCGPLGFICAGELPSNRLRAATYGMGSAIGFVANFVISLTTPYFINPESLNIGAKIGYIWAASNLVTFAFVFFCFPEIHRRSLENIDEMFYAKVPMRKFKGYRCTGIVHHGGVLDQKEGAKELENVSRQQSRAN